MNKQTIKDHLHKAEHVLGRIHLLAWIAGIALSGIGAAGSWIANNVDWLKFWFAAIVLCLIMALVNVWIRRREQNAAKPLPDSSEGTLSTRVFLSYNRDDKEAVRKLVDALTSRGLLIDWDQNLPIGENWQENIEKAIRNARAILVVFGKNGFGKWHKDEIHVSLVERKKRGIPLIPIFLRGAPEPEQLYSDNDVLFLGQFQRVHFPRGLRDTKGLESIVAAIKGKLPPPAKPQTPQTGSGQWSIRKHPLRYVAGLLLVLALLVGLALYLGHRGPRITLNARNEEVSSVLTRCASQVGAVLALKGVHGRISLAVTDVEFKSAMDSICGAVNCDWKLTEGKPPALLVTPKGATPRQSKNGVEIW